MPVTTYFSHSYRLEDQRLNKLFWEHFKSDFAFLVDPPSAITIHTHLERMMRRCSAFVAIFQRRKDVPKLNCSPFMLYEYGLAVQARRPKLLLIDNNIDATPFEKLDERETFYFSPAQPLARLNELRKKIDELRDVARAYPDALSKPRGKIAVVVPRDRASCAYANKAIMRRIGDVAEKHGFKVDTVVLPHKHNADLALEFDQYEALVLDVRGKDLPDWVFPYAHGRLVPTIKLARLEPNELIGSFVMPPIVEGLRMDMDEPGVESVLYWRNTEDLTSQLERAFLKMDEDLPPLETDDQAILYFDSIGRRPANVFISNAGKDNPLARRLSQELVLRNIKRFHYKDANTIPTSSVWPKEIRAAVENCNVFVAIIGSDYERSVWSREELRIACARDAQIVLLPYAVEGTNLNFLREHGLQDRQVSPLPDNEEASLKLILADIHSRLTDEGRGHNMRIPRTTILGGSREAVIDTIRHVSKSSWVKLLARLSRDGVKIRVPSKDSGPIRSRAVAETLVEGTVQADTDQTSDDSIIALVKALTEVAPRTHRKLITNVADRIGKGAAGVTV